MADATTLLGRIQGLIGDITSDPLFNMGLGLLSASGPSLAPVSLGQGLAQGAQFASRAQQEALQNQLIRSRIEADKRQRESSEQLRGLFGDQAVAGLPAGALGLLFDMAPDAAAKGLLGAAFPTPLSALEQATLGKVLLDLNSKGTEAAATRAGLEDTVISAKAGLNAMDTIAKIPGADIFMTNPSLIGATRQALSLGRLDPTGLLASLPSEISGIPPAQLQTALNAAETVNKQRNALGFSLSNQAGVAGLRARLEALGEGAGLDVQRGVFDQALKRALREAEKAGQPINLDDLVPEPAPTEVLAPTQPPTSTTITPQPGVPVRSVPTVDIPGLVESGTGLVQQGAAALVKQFPSQSDLVAAFERGRVKVGDVVTLAGDAARKFSGKFPNTKQLEAAVKAGRVRVGDFVAVGGQIFRIDAE